MSADPAPLPPTAEESLEGLAVREARFLALTTRASPPPVVLRPHPCSGCGAGTAEALAQARAQPFGRISVGPPREWPTAAQDVVVVECLACERLPLSVLIALAHLRERAAAPPVLRSRSAAARLLARDGVTAPGELLCALDASERWFDVFLDTGARPLPTGAPVTLPAQFETFAGPVGPSAGGGDGAEVLLRYVEELNASGFLSPHSPHRLPEAVDRRYEELRSAALWGRLRELNAGLPPGPRVPFPERYALLTHPPGPADGHIPLP
ncbi:hypothetical protein OHT52_12770 [Streptomyces sp. NBC_00247]|uniref:hypothetical protein n=1 Tax=Streptomyces sp. NBC_00247 TaxID=2975689 RepID=UPI002E2D7D6D|nr:hypothetical protein [Streptomyces sp. NBC_00247]